jgi:hypothetical protein
MMAATERPKTSPISDGVLFCIHKSRKTASCSCQLGPIKLGGATVVSVPEAKEAPEGIDVSVSLTRILRKLKEKLILYLQT